MKIQFFCTVLSLMIFVLDAFSINYTNIETTAIPSDESVTKRLQLPECLNNHPQCCQQGTLLEGCPQQMCSLPLCQDQKTYPNNVNTKKQEGDECGPCLSQIGNCGVCEDGLECVRHLHDEYLHEAPYRCRNSSDAAPTIYTTAYPEMKNDIKERPIDQEKLGNIRNDPRYQWKERTERKYNKCFPRFETKFRDKCEEYEEEKCYTKHEEQCTKMSFRNCALVPKETHDRKCETVNEQICHLKKSYRTEHVLDYVPKQKCHQSTKRICDSVWQFDHSTNDDFICKKVSKPKCTEKWTILYEKTCKATFRFDCRTKNPINAYGNWALNPLHQVHRYENGPAYPGEENYTLNKYSNKDFENFQCRKTPIKRCHRTPRRVKTHDCEQVDEEQCQKVTNNDPRPIQRQSCHDEPYEECEIESEHQPKVMQVPIYTEDCKVVPREICDNQGTTTLEVKCVDEFKPVCKWAPSNKKCHKTPRKHCYKIPYQEKTTDCDESYNEDLEINEDHMTNNFEENGVYSHSPEIGYRGIS